MKPFKIEPNFEEINKEKTPEKSRVLAENGKENLRKSAEKRQKNESLMEFTKKILEIIEIPDKNENLENFSTENLEKVITKS